jgi:signal transduction histidine kinase
VIINLLTNALKYGNRNPVEVSVARMKKTVRISVKDRGIGIAEDKKGLIFERFERGVDSSNISGLGLGLYIARQIVFAHHGSVSVESRLGHGSVFSVDLPLDMSFGLAEQEQSI